MLVEGVSRCDYDVLDSFCGVCKGRSGVLCSPCPFCPTSALGVAV